jgi:hypothetical protein
MADGFDYDVDDYYDEDWLYVEDEFDLAVCDQPRFC